MKILLAEDDNSIRRGVEVFLKTRGYKVSAVDNGQSAIDECAEHDFDLVISDVKMPGKTGLELLEHLQNKNSRIPVIIITAFATVKNAVTAMKQGASDFLTKPLDLEELALKIEKIEQQNQILKENKTLKKQLAQFSQMKIVGCSKALNEVNKMITMVAQEGDIPVMIYGESGTGKELAARAIHRQSIRKNKPFVAVNCAAFPEELMESELFGYKKGAFTNAIKDKSGFFKAAAGGTLFLDEVSEMSPGMQAKLLRSLQEGIIQPLGTTVPEKIEVRVLGASNKNLKEMVEANKFREDLFYRLNVIEVVIPPLRERQEDIPFLIDFFLEKHKNNKALPLINSEIIRLIQSYSWPGNIRELENFIRKLLITCQGQEVKPSDLSKEMLDSNSVVNKQHNSLLSGSDYKKELKKVIENFEKNYFDFHLHKNLGNVSKTAEILDISRAALHKKIKQYGL